MLFNDSGYELACIVLCITCNTDDAVVSVDFNCWACFNLKNYCRLVEINFCYHFCVFFFFWFS